MNISFTPAAEKFINRMLRFSPTPTGGFRLVAKTGGCSGLAAEFTVEATPFPGDKVKELGASRIFLDAESRILLEGATVDFADTAVESGFVIRTAANPTGSCSTHAAPELVSLGKF